MRSVSLSLRIFVVTASIATLLEIIWFAYSWDGRYYGTFLQSIPMLVFLSPIFASVALLAALFTTLLWGALGVVVGDKRCTEIPKEEESSLWRTLVSVVLAGAAATAATLVSPWIEWIPYKFKAPPLVWVSVFLIVAGFSFTCLSLFRTRSA